jgi:hypothetical protein
VATCTCGSVNRSSAIYCDNCGVRLDQFDSSTPAIHSVSVEKGFAGFWRRLNFDKAQVAVIGVALALVCVLGLWIGRSSSSPNGTTPKALSTSAVLAPASTPSRVGVCTHALTMSADGNASPLRCTNREVNRLAWNYYVRIGPLVMTLGPSEPFNGVVKSMCADMQLSNATLPEAKNAATLASDYYGWGLTRQIGSYLPTASC